MKNKTDKENKLLKKGRKRYTKKQLFIKKLIPTFIITGICFSMIAAFAVNFLRTELMNISTSYVSNIIQKGYINNKGDAFAQNMVSLSSAEDELVSFYTGIYDKNGEPYIIPKDTLILSYKESEDTKGLSVLEVNDEYIHCLDAVKEKYDAMEMGHDDDFHTYVLTRYYADDKHFIPAQGYVKGADGTRAEDFSFEAAVPEGYTEYNSENYKVCSIRFCENTTDPYHAEYVAGKVKESMDYSVINLPDMKLIINPLMIDGENYMIAEAVWVDLGKMIKYAAINTIIAAVVFSVIISILLASKKYAELSAHYAIEDYRKDMTNKLAHDLKSPLMVISGYAENLQDNVNTDKSEHYAEAILENVKYMDNIIADVLELSRLEDGSVKPEITEFDAALMAREIASNYEGLTEKNSITVKTEGTAMFKADKTLMRNILDNLIGNAVKYTDMGGRILIECTPGRISITNDCVMAGKLDTDSLLKPFVKGDSSRSGRKGSGLGLSIAAEAARKTGLSLTLNADDNSFTAVISE